MEIVLKAIAGESVEALSREYKVGVAEIEKWKDQFLQGGQAYLNIRKDTPEGKKLNEAQATISKIAMEIEALKKDRTDLSKLELVTELIGSKSEATGKIFSTRFILNRLKISPATWYAKKSGKKSSKKRGPKTLISDQRLAKLSKRKLIPSHFFKLDIKNYIFIFEKMAFV